MAQDTDEIVIGADGNVMVADVGTAAPTTPTGAYGAGWEDLGLASEDGVTITDSKTMFEVPVWQLFYPGRRGIEGRDFQASFVLRQWNPATFEFAFGGATVTALTGGAGSKLSPPSPEVVDERALGIDWRDGDKDYRLILPKGMVSEDVETQLARGTAADLPITFGIIGQAGVDPWTGYTNDPAFA
jgi:hypothetical protein